MTSLSRHAESVTLTGWLGQSAALPQKSRASQTQPQPPKAQLRLRLLGISSVVFFTLLSAQAPDKLPASLENVAFDQRLDAAVPLDLELYDEHGNQVRIADFVSSRPAILVLVQYRCPMLCNLILKGLLQSLGDLSFDAGREFEVITVSFDAREEPPLAAAQKQACAERYDRSGTEHGWHFLTGDQASIDRLTEAVGFRYKFDAVQDRFAHPSGLVLLTPQGRIARYFFGVEYSPRDLRLGLVEASQNRIGTAIDQVMLFCYGYDAKAGKYTAAVMRMVRGGAVATILAIGLLMVRGRFKRSSDLSPLDG